MSDKQDARLEVVAPVTFAQAFAELSDRLESRADALKLDADAQTKTVSEMATEIVSYVDSRSQLHMRAGAAGTTIRAELQKDVAKSAITLLDLANKTNRISDGEQTLLEFLCGPEAQNPQGPGDKL